MNHSRSAPIAFKAGISAVFLAVVLWFSDLSQLMGQFQNLNWGSLTTAFIGVMGMQFLLAYKLHWILGTQTLPLGKIVRIQFISTFANNIFPGSLGGDLVKSFYFGKEIQSYKKSLGIILVDRGTGFALQLILTFSTYFVFILFSRQEGTLVSVAGILLGLGLALALGKPLLKLANLFLQFLPQGSPRFNQIREDLYLGLNQLGHSKFQWPMIIILSFLAQLLLALILYFLLISLGATIPLSYIFFLNFLSTAANYIPLTLGNLGLREGLFAGYFEMLKKGGETGLGTAILFRALLIPPGIVGAYFYLLFRSQSHPGAKINGDSAPKVW